MPANERSLLRPSSQIGIVVPSAELDQARAAVEVATLILERVGLALRFFEDNAIRVVIVGVDFVAVAIGQTNYGTLPIEVC